MRWLARLSLLSLERVVPGRLASLVLRRRLGLAIGAGEAGAKLASLYAALARVEDRRGHRSEALSFLRAAVDQSHPEDVSWYYCEMGRLAEAQGSYREAVSYYSRALTHLEPEASAAFRARIQGALRSCEEQADQA